VIVEGSQCGNRSAAPASHAGRPDSTRSPLKLRDLATHLGEPLQLLAVHQAGELVVRLDVGRLGRLGLVVGVAVVRLGDPGRLVGLRLVRGHRQAVLVGDVVVNHLVLLMNIVGHDRAVPSPVMNPNELRMPGRKGSGPQRRL
jgi:hypothetical protein